MLIKTHTENLLARFSCITKINIFLVYCINHDLNFVGNFLSRSDPCESLVTHVMVYEGLTASHHQ